MQTDNPSRAYRSPWMTEELEILRTAVRKFVQSELVPYEPTWQKQGYVDREAWLKAGEMGIVLADIPEEYGGAGEPSPMKPSFLKNWPMPA